MGHSQAEKAESRERILEATAQQIREGGFDRVSIGELMKSAHLTHGGFYRHFRSRSALIAAALGRALDRGEAAFGAAPAKTPGSVKSIVNRYLNTAHRDDTSGGCAIAALAADVGRSDDEEIRQQMAERVELSFDRMAKAMGDGDAAADAAVTAWCAMIGAVVLSRVFRGQKRSDEILKQVRRSVLDLETRLRDQTDTAIGAPLDQR